MTEQPILVIDDEQHLCSLFTEVLSRDGHRVLTANKGQQGLAMLADAPDGIGMVFLDVKLPDMAGIEVLREIKRRSPTTPVVMVTGYATKESAVEAMRMGAYDYLAKPFNINDICLVARRALERTHLIDENRYLRDELRLKYNFDNIVGNDESTQAAYVLAAKVANQNATVLVTGESGTGKEMLARTIHFQSKRAEKPFVKVNCAALPEHLLEDELFGHEKGAFTDASAQRIGRFEWAHTGTLFLDEIGEVPLSVQVKLLRVLQEREFERIGSSKTIKVDVRIIAATNRDLEKAIADGTFREDLFYRLNVVPIELPPLRSRPGDITVLAGHFIDKYCTETGRDLLQLSDAALQELKCNAWKGNIRELENCIERAVILAEDHVIEPRHLLLAPSGSTQSAQARAVSSTRFASSTAATSANAATSAIDSSSNAVSTMREMQKKLVSQALRQSENNLAAAARALDISLLELQSLMDNRAPDAETESIAANGVVTSLGAAQAAQDELAGNAAVRHRKIARKTA